MTTLKDYIIRLRESRGLMYQRNLETLRNYLNTTPEEQIIKEVLTLETIDDLQILWSAGLKKRIQLVALDHYKQLTEVR